MAAITFQPTALERETRTALPTGEAAFHLNRAQQTLRLWAMREDADQPQQSKVVRNRQARPGQVPLNNDEIPLSRRDCPGLTLKTIKENRSPASPGFLTFGAGGIGTKPCTAVCKQSVRHQETTQTKKPAIN